MQGNLPSIVVLGRGMLGQDVIHLFQQIGYPIHSFDLPEWDITSPQAVREAVQMGEIIINCAAYTNVDGAENQEDLAYAVNRDGVAYVAKSVYEKGGYLIHISTDFVFDGTKKDPYNEDDKPNPINVYGRSKLAGERAIFHSGARAVILRIQWTYGNHGRHFIAKIRELASSRDQIQVVADQYGSPTSTQSVARAILAMVQKQPTGIYHYAAQGYTSRFECAQVVVETLQLPCRIVPCSSDQFPTPAKRPLNSRFDCTRFDRDIAIFRPHWKQELIQFLTKQKECPL